MNKERPLSPDSEHPTSFLPSISTNQEATYLEESSEEGWQAANIAVEKRRPPMAEIDRPYLQEAGLYTGESTKEVDAKLHTGPNVGRSAVASAKVALGEDRSAGKAEGWE